MIVMVCRRRRRGEGGKLAYATAWARHDAQQVTRDKPWSLALVNTTLED